MDGAPAGYRIYFVFAFILLAEDWGEGKGRLWGNLGTKHYGWWCLTVGH